MNPLPIIAILLSQILTQDMEGCTDIDALNCDFNPEPCEDVDADGICENSSDWWNHCDSCPDIPCNGFYDPEATFENGTCQYNQVPIWESSIWFTATPGQIQIDWSLFESPVNDINAFVIQRCLADGTCSFVENASNIDTFLGTDIIDHYDWVSGENINYYMGVYYANNSWWSQAKGQYNFNLGCIDPADTNYNPEADVDDGSCEGQYLFGDVNIDDSVNVLDIVIIVNHIVGISPFQEEDQLIISDANLDNTVNVLDVVILVNYILGN